MVQKLIPPVPLGEEFDSAPVGQWMELVRRYINEPPVFSGVANPTTADIARGTWVVYKNTTSGEVRVWTNDNGVMKSVLLS